MSEQVPNESTQLSTAQSRVNRQLLALKRRLVVASQNGDLYEMGQVYRLLIARYYGVSDFLIWY